MNASLHRLYAGKQMSVTSYLSQESDCGVGPLECNLVSMNDMLFKMCDDSQNNIDEFATFEDLLSSVAQSDQLNVGVQRRSCTGLYKNR